MLTVWSLLATSIPPYPAVDCDCILVLLFHVGWLCGLLSAASMKEQLSSHAIHTQRLMLIGEEEKCFNMGAQNSAHLFLQLTEIGFTYIFPIGGLV